MKKSILLSVSVLNADFMRLAESLKSIDPYADSFHVDIMDGTITPLISFGTWVIPSLKKIIQTPLEIHLYVRNPTEILEEVLEMGVERVLVDQRTLTYLIENSMIHCKERMGLYVLSTDSLDTHGMSIFEHVSLVNVVTVCSLQGGQTISWDLIEKTKRLDKLREENGFQFDISVDGGINHDVLDRVLSFPIDQVIIGSAIFTSGNPAENAMKLREFIRSSR